MYYLFIIISMAVISVVDIFCIPAVTETAWYVIGFVCLTTLAVVIIDLIFAGIVRWILPVKFFSPDKTSFAAGKKECRFYEKLGIKNWKDKIPELGKLTNFRKNKIRDPKNNEYVKRYITEANYGVAVHISGIIFGFAVVLVNLKYWYCIGIPIAVVNAVYNALSLFILRYNLPKLHTLYKLNERRERLEKRRAEESVSAENPKTESDNSAEKIQSLKAGSNTSADSSEQNG